MSSAVFCTRYLPSDVGHGGDHRAYQILHDLELTVGKDNVAVVSFPRWRRRVPRPPLLVRVRRGLARYVENPCKLLGYKGFSAGTYSTPKLLAHYARMVERLGKPAVCVIQHAGFAGVLPLNSRHTIPTIICPDNLEAFDTNVLRYRQGFGMYATALDFVNEFSVLRQCAERLFISRVEAGLIGGLGLPSYYYPYVPVGLIRGHLERIRHERSKGYIEPDLFLMLGTAGHATTRASFEWFIKNVQKCGLPRGVRLIVVGAFTEDLLPSGTSVPGLELRGWLEQGSLDQLLVRAAAVLIPQQTGFGALTRLPELSCAGIPVVASRHATHAIDPLPGLRIVDDDCWDAWYAEIEQFAVNKVGCSQAEYSAWEERQPRMLQTAAKRLLGDFVCDAEEDC